MGRMIQTIQEYYYCMLTGNNDSTGSVVPTEPNEPTNKTFPGDGTGGKQRSKISFVSNNNYTYSIMIMIMIIFLDFNFL